MTGPLHASSAAMSWLLLGSSTIHIPIISGFAPARHNLPRDANPPGAPLNAWDGESRAKNPNSGNYYKPEDEQEIEPAGVESNFFKFTYEGRFGSNNSMFSSDGNDGEEDDAADAIDFKTSPLPTLRSLDWIPTEEQLEKLTLQELRLACQQRQLSKFGSADAIMDRVRAWSAKERINQEKKAERRRIAKAMLSKSKRPDYGANTAAKAFNRNNIINRGNDMYGQVLPYRSNAARRSEPKRLYTVSRQKCVI